MRLFCKGSGCKNFIDVSEPVAKKCDYICRDCAPKDLTNMDLHFQEVQFDRKLGSRAITLNSGGRKIKPAPQDAHR